MKIVKQDIDLPLLKGFQELFAKDGISVRTKKKISFERHPTGQFIATFNLLSDPEHGINIDLLTDYNNLEQLVQVHGLCKPDDIHSVTPSDLWVRYLGGDGYVCVDIEGLDAELCFRIVKSITMVYSADLSFFQEIPHVLSMTHQFEKYVMENMPRFMVAAGMRPLLLSVWVP